MMTMMRARAFLTAGGITILTAVTADGQSLARRIADAPNGKVRLEFAARPDLCGTGSYVSRGSHNRMSWDSDQSEDVEYTEECMKSPVRVVVTKSGGQVVRIRTYVGGRWRPAVGTVTSIGPVSTREAVDYLMSVANTSSTRVGSEAIFPMTLADSVEIWQGLLRMARDASRPNGIRTQAVFWLSQTAGEAITANLAALTGDAAVDRDVREQAVFALSQRPRSEGVPALINIARTNRDPEIRKKALFWLGQSRDPRALALFEEILSRR
ncbi:MAG: HEAT repeat domain-containing protein [Gemmatimonadota bacterium]|nr:HEAT repeat domain-containing protein [Gemmatimonadota bacterium]